MYLNNAQLSAVLGVPNSRVREAYQRDRITPDAFDGGGRPLFAFVRIHAFAAEVNAPGAAGPYALRLSGWNIEPFDICVDPPTNE